MARYGPVVCLAAQGEWRNFSSINLQLLRAARRILYHVRLQLGTKTESQVVPIAAIVPLLPYLPAKRIIRIYFEIIVLIKSLVISALIFRRKPS